MVRKVIDLLEEGPTKVAVRHPPHDGLNEIARLNRTISESRRGGSRHQLILRVVTFDGRVQQDLAFLQLDRSESIAVKVLSQRDASPENPAFKGVVGYTALGKPYLDLLQFEMLGTVVQVAYSKLLQQEFESANVGYLDFYTLDWFRSANA